MTPWEQALRQRLVDLLVLAAGVLTLFLALLLADRRLAGHPRFLAMRLSALAVVIVFVGWWGQGQLSIATVLGVLRSAASRQSVAFLLYDPFSLLLWSVTLASFVIWGRGFFCGWLCPFGAMQEFMHHAGRMVGLMPFKPTERVDAALRPVKYAVLLCLVIVAFAAPDAADALIEVEPFKTAVTTYFLREWYFVAYAVALLAISMVVFKFFCRYLCPLGAVMAIGGLLRRKDWIARRSVCGSPCQLCKVRCNYNAIRPDGRIRYDECFQCLDCVTIYDDPKQCVPLVLAARGRQL